MCCVPEGAQVHSPGTFPTSLNERGRERELASLSSLAYYCLSIALPCLTLQAILCHLLCLLPSIFSVLRHACSALFSRLSDRSTIFSWTVAPGYGLWCTGLCRAYARWGFRHEPGFCCLLRAQRRWLQAKSTGHVSLSSSAWAVGCGLKLSVVCSRRCLLCAACLCYYF